MSKFKLGEEVIHKGRLYKIYEVIYQESIAKGNHTFYTLQDKNLGLIRHIYEDDIKKKPRYTITISDGSQDRVLYAEDRHKDYMDYQWIWMKQKWMDYQ